MQKVTPSSPLPERKKLQGPPWASPTPRPSGSPDAKRPNSPTMLLRKKQQAGPTLVGFSRSTQGEKAATNTGDRKENTAASPMGSSVTAR
jgi:hypothetical protein